MTAATRNGDTLEVAILGRLLGNGDRALPSQMARYVIQLEFSEEDKSRMRDLAARNQDDALAAKEKTEMLAFAKAGTILSILKSKARQALSRKPKKRQHG
jgi:hypothetical protein